VTQDVTRASDDDLDSPVWSLRGVVSEVRVRMKVQAAMKHRTIPDLVELACRFWLANGTPDKAERYEDEEEGDHS
jgi:hypothetical protein